LKKIFLIGDSYGGPRKFPCRTVDLEETWPALLSNEFGANCEYDFKSFRCLIECVEILSKADIRYDVVVIGAGIVDIFPRTLPYHLSRSQNILLKIFRVFVRSTRGWWIKYIYWKPWFSYSNLEFAIIEALVSCENLILLTVPQLAEKHAEKNPNAQEILNAFNSFIMTKEYEFPGKIHCLDAASIIKKVGLNSCLDPNDSHYTARGNSTIAEALKPLISKIIDE